MDFLMYFVLFAFLSVILLCVLAEVCMKGSTI